MAWTLIHEPWLLSRNRFRSHVIKLIPWIFVTDGAHTSSRENWDAIYSRNSFSIPWEEWVSESLQSHSPVVEGVTSSSQTPPLLDGDSFPSRISLEEIRVSKLTKMWNTNFCGQEIRTRPAVWKSLTLQANYVYKLLTYRSVTWHYVYRLSGGLHRNIRICLTKE
jgi:hypothetical protein